MGGFLHHQMLMSSVGHVEKTNDRDYEVEERYGDLSRTLPLWSWLVNNKALWRTDDTAQWSLLRIDFRKRPKGT